jgi:hypothetical protein
VTGEDRAIEGYSHAQNLRIDERMCVIRSPVF